ncbi:hypothetical protein E2F43_18250 [Seongchinamella unica]|uniref:Uncharacterized protein n=1 Tax=Seongchinamella unica TaxID=2547392 RepID=A0A4R5LN58_9GAMM|nr:hypothetical protein [Seongchinamella unica]TDG11653.1 hypothetical protein E2F43_18250 [Seongchinamella unica]
MPTKKSCMTSDNTIQVMKQSNCPTSSGKSKLGYSIGIDEAGEIYLKLTSNSGGGFFSEEWVDFTAIQGAWNKWPQDQPLTSFALSKMFRGKSANNPGFLTAVLLAEGLLERDGDNKRVYRVADPGPFLASIKGTEKGSKKPARKAKAPPRKSTTTRRKSATPSRKSR